MELRAQLIDPSECTEQTCRDWMRLAVNAADANPFYEHWALLPALRQLADQRVEVLAVFDVSNDSMVGLFPFCGTRGFRGLPLYRTALWRHPYCYLCTPLIDRAQLSPVIDFVLSWLRHHAPESLSAFCSWYWVDGDGRMATQIISATQGDARVCGHTGGIHRAALTLSGNYETDFVARLRKRKRKEWARAWRRLGEAGNLAVDFLDAASSPGEVIEAIEQFLLLEQAGWKGEQGTALNSKPETAAFFRELLQSAHQSGQSVIGRITLEGEPVAMITVILDATGQQAFTLKIATDERFQRYSPGSQMILRLTEYLFKSPTVRYVDSCAAEDHPMINWLWSERRHIANLHLANRRVLPRMLVAATDVMQRVVRPRGS